MRFDLTVALLAAGGLTAVMTSAPAADAVEVSVVIKDHRFMPAELTVPAGRPVTITVDNQDPTPEEFESLKAHVEKVVPGKTRVIVRIRALEPGRYPFVGEFNEATARGVIVVE